MPTYRKRGAKWRAEVCVNGVRRSQSFQTKAEARAWAERAESEIELGVHATAGTARLGDAMQRYADEISSKRESGRWEIIRLRQMQRHKIARVRLDRLQPAHIAEWRDDRLEAVKPASVRREFNLLRSVLEQCRREWRLIASNPSDDVRKPGNSRPRDQRVIPDDADRIALALGFDAADPEIRTMQQRAAVAFLLAIESGMRAGEIVSLTWDQVYLDKRFVHLDRTKNGDERDVPLTSRAVELIEILESGRQDGDDRMLELNRTQLDSHFRKGRDHSGLRHIAFHDSRHEAITRLARKVDVMTLARLVGHRDLRSLLTYYNESAADIAQRLG